MTSSQTSLSIPPSPRILKILADIEFSEWQCFAELIDNGFDEFLEIERQGLKWPDGFKVSISLPKKSDPLEKAQVTIADTGRGMDLETLRNSVRAGWSGNDRFSKLGLFGMGFNIATAKLGKVTRVLSTRSGDDEWVGLEIDLDAIGDDFQVPVLRREKQSKREHGTVIEISRLERRRFDSLTGNPAKMREILGEVYSYLLREEGFELYVAGQKVRPVHPCVWDSSRSVTYGRGSTAEQIPAVILIDQEYPPALACENCGNWQKLEHGETCIQCGSESVSQRERRIHGWLGIQRHLHKTDFGIDFLRNGRKILRRDKRLFEWSNPHDPLGQPETEYPVELGQGGRIVGEIHLDHVPVNYQKDAFEWSDRHWIAARDFLRGEGPLLPQKARKLGYGMNESSLGQLHRGYRRTDPGYRYLVPGDGKGPIHDTTLKWRERFLKGEPEYQDDRKWWEAVEFHEKQRAAAENEGSEADPDMDILDELDLSGSDETTSGEDDSAPPPDKPETLEERKERYRESAVEIPGLTRHYSVPEFGKGIDVKALLVRGTELLDEKDQRTPVYMVQDQGGQFSVFVDEGHPVFQQFADSASDYLSVVVAEHLRVRAGSTMGLPQAVARLKEENLSDESIDHVVLSQQAGEIFSQIQEAMVDAVADDVPRAWQTLSPEERSETETNIGLEDDIKEVDDLIQTGAFLTYAPALFVPRLVESWPEAFFDGSVFTRPYGTLVSDEAKRVQLAKVVSYLYDAALVIKRGKELSQHQLERSRISLQLLRREVLSDGGAS